MRALGLLLVLLLVWGCANVPPVVDGPGIEGRYVVNGVDPNGTEYSGLVTIGAISNSDELAFEWVITGAVLEGLGTVNGDLVTVTWTSSDGPRGSSTGTAEYTVEPGGRLVGTRTVDGIDGFGTEEIIPEP